jgi:hypothetical protein
LDRDYKSEDVLQHAKQAFTETIALKVKHLRRYVPKNTNPELTGDFVEELVRGFIQDWIGHRLLVKGTLYSSEFEKTGEKALQIDGIIYDPTRGPMIMHEGSFGVVHPVFCAGVMEIKTSYSNLSKFRKRLDKIHALYMHHVRKCQVMGIVIADSKPEVKSRISHHGESYWAYSYDRDSCPIFVLFKEEDGEYEPFEPAVDAMIRAVYANLWTNPVGMWLR